MTPTTSTSSILLLGGAGDGVKAAPATAAAGADASGDAAPGGFQLLLAELSQQLQLPGVPAAPATAAKGAGADDETTTETTAGNALPLTGLILPFALQNAAPAPTDAGDAPKKQEQSASDDSGAEVLQLFPLLQPMPVQAAAATGTKTQADAAAAVDITPELAALADPGQSTSTGPKSDKSSRGQAGLTLGQLAVTAADGSDGAAAAAAIELPGIAAASASEPESDFDALLKHFDTTPAPTANTTAMTDGARPQALPRAYADAAASANANATVPVPVGDQGWSDAVADKVMWFSANKLSSAEIHLNPPDLGPLQVRINTQHDQASVVFSSQHAQVRDALDQALPRLRDMLGSQGIQLLDVSVGGQGAQQQQYARGDSSGQPQRQGSGSRLLGDDSAGIEPVAVTTVSSLRLPRSGVDAYA